MAAHRYWRVVLRSTSIGNYSYSGLQHIDFQDAQGNTLCVGGVASANAFDSNHPPANAFPGGPGLWYTDYTSRKAWIQYDFGAGKAVEPAQVALMATAAVNYPIFMDVQYSDDNQTFTTAWSITKPPNWQLDTKTWIFANRSSTFAPAKAAAKNWMMLQTQTRGQLDGGTNGINLIIPEMRFYDGQGDVIPTFTSPLGSYVAIPGNANSEDWSLAWDGNPATQVSTASPQAFDPGDTPQFCHVAYPSLVAVYGLSILSGSTGSGVGADFQYTPASGFVLNSDDGLSWAYAWQFNDGNREASPPVGNGANNMWNVPAPPPPTPSRKLSLSQAMMGSF